MSVTASRSHLAIQRENKQLHKDLRRYEEMFDTYQALLDVERAKKSGQLKKLRSLADLM